MSGQRPGPVPGNGNGADGARKNVRHRAQARVEGPVKPWATHERPRRPPRVASPAAGVKIKRAAGKKRRPGRPPAVPAAATRGHRSAGRSRAFARHSCSRQGAASARCCSRPHCNSRRHARQRGQAVTLSWPGSRCPRRLRLAGTASRTRFLPGPRRPCRGP